MCEGLVISWRLDIGTSEPNDLPAGDFVPQFHSFRVKAFEKLEFLEAASTLADLRLPPSNHFEKLSGNRNGQYSIRINKQWRTCFEWSHERAEAFNIEIVDYH